MEIQNVQLSENMVHLIGELFAEYEDGSNRKWIRSYNRVWMNGKELDPGQGQELRNHSPDGFNWGYGGSGPAQLALSICLELYGKVIALMVYQDFKWKVVAKIPQGDKFEYLFDRRAFEREFVDPIVAKN